MSSGGSDIATAYTSIRGVDPNLIPRNYKDRTFSYSEIYGHSQEEKARRDAARRPNNDYHFQLSR